MNCLHRKGDISSKQYNRDLEQMYHLFDTETLLVHGSGPSSHTTIILKDSVLAVLVSGKDSPTTGLDSPKLGECSRLSANHSPQIGEWHPPYSVRST